VSVAHTARRTDPPGSHERVSRIAADMPVSRLTASPYADARMNAVPTRTAIESKWED